MLPVPSCLMPGQRKLPPSSREAPGKECCWAPARCWRTLRLLQGARPRERVRRVRTRHGLKGQGTSSNKCRLSASLGFSPLVQMLGFLPSSHQVCPAAADASESGLPVPERTSSGSGITGSPAHLNSADVHDACAPEASAPWVLWSKAKPASS